MVISAKRSNFLLLTTLFCLFTVAGLAESPVAIRSIQLTYKRDPRVVDSYRGIGPWAPGPSFGGANAQDTVEVRAEGLDAAGRPVKINPQWISSDPEMVSVSPSQGDDVKITVRRAGESVLMIRHQGFSMQLEVKAQSVNSFMQFEIAPPPAPKPTAAVATEAPPAHNKTKNDVSYAAGMNLAKALEEQSVQVDVDLLLQGIKDFLSGGKTLMSEVEAEAALTGLQTDDRIVQANLSRKALGERNKREGAAFLAENRKKEGVVTLPSGLQYKIIKMGEGKKPTTNDTVTIRYRGTFIDGREFDNTFKKAFVTIPVNAGIQGWKEALQLMPVGSKWQIFVPSDLAYGEHGAGGQAGGKRAGGASPQIVGPNATLIFELELQSVQDAAATGTVVATPEPNEPQTEAQQKKELR